MHSHQCELPRSSPSSLFPHLYNNSTMASKVEIKELPSIGTRVLEIAWSLGYKEGAFSFNLTFDKTIFAMDTEHPWDKDNPSPHSVEKKRISPSSRRWSKRRKENFLKQKRASSTPDPFVGTSTSTRPDIPSCEISQRGRSRTERQRTAAGES